MIYGILIGFLIIVPILVAYYYDYKRNPKEFTFSIKTLGRGLIYIGIYVAIVTIYKTVFPINKNYGIDFNSERKKLGIPIIGENWKISDSESEQFKTYWWKPEPRSGHFKKIIEYGILNAKTETDFYQNKKLERTFAWSTFNYENKTFEYYIEKPNENIISVTEKGNIKFEKDTYVTKVNKIEFEKYITK